MGRRRGHRRRRHVRGHGDLRRAVPAERVGRRRGEHGAGARRGVPTAAELRVRRQDARGAWSIDGDVDVHDPGRCREACTGVVVRPDDALATTSNTIVHAVTIADCVDTTDGTRGAADAGDAGGTDAADAAARRPSSPCLSPRRCRGPPKWPTVVSCRAPRSSRRPSDARRRSCSHAPFRRPERCLPRAAQTTTDSHGDRDCPRSRNVCAPRRAGRRHAPALGDRDDRPSLAAHPDHGAGARAPSPTARRRGRAPSSAAPSCACTPCRTRPCDRGRPRHHRCGLGPVRHVPRPGPAVEKTGGILREGTDRGQRRRIQTHRARRPVGAHRRRAGRCRARAVDFALPRPPTERAACGRTPPSRPASTRTRSRSSRPSSKRRSSWPTPTGSSTTTSVASSKAS